MLALGVTQVSVARALQYAYEAHLNVYSTLLTKSRDIVDSTSALSNP